MATDYETEKDHFIREQTERLQTLQAAQVAALGFSDEGIIVEMSTLGESFDIMRRGRKWDPQILGSDEPVPDEP